MNDDHVDRVLRSMEPIGCVLTSEGMISEVSEGWKQAADRNGLQLRDYAIGTNYLKHCLTREPASLETYRGLSKVLSRQAPFYGAVYPCSATDSDPRWFFMAAYGFAARAERTLVLHLDISESFETRLGEVGSADESLLLTVRRAVREELSQFAVAGGVPNNHSDEKRLAKLTPRQTELLRLLARGSSNAQIAAQLGIALSSVKTQTASLLRALNCSNRTQAGILGAKFGFDQASPDKQL